MEKERTNCERDLYLQALNMRNDIEAIQRQIADGHAQLTVLKPQYEKMKDNLTKHGTYKEEDFK